MTDRTITIPADLREGFTPADIREIAASVVPHPAGDPEERRMARQTKRVLGWLADEIEKQTPREPGWYHVRSHNPPEERVLWWNGRVWVRDPRQPIGTEEYVSNATITRVTIGASS